MLCSPISIWLWSIGGGLVVGWLLGHNLPGWTSLMAAVGLLGGMQFLMLGVIGAYLGRLYDQSKGRPLFMIRDIVGGGPRDAG